MTLKIILVEYLSSFFSSWKVALWLEDEKKGNNFGSVEEDTIALEVSDGNNKFYYIPACASIPEWLLEKLDNSALVFDGTLWQDDEMIIQNVGIKTGKRMGHISMSGENGSIESLNKIKINEKYSFISILQTQHYSKTLKKEL